MYGDAGSGRGRLCGAWPERLLDGLAVADAGAEQLRAEVRGHRPHGKGRPARRRTAARARTQHGRGGRTNARRTRRHDYRWRPRRGRRGRRVQVVGHRRQRGWRTAAVALVLEQRARAVPAEVAALVSRTNRALERRAVRPCRPVDDAEGVTRRERRTASARLRELQLVAHVPFRSGRPGRLVEHAALDARPRDVELPPVAVLVGRGARAALHGPEVLPPGRRRRS